jgi:hypothetical protein
MANEVWTTISAASLDEEDPVTDALAEDVRDDLLYLKNRLAAYPAVHRGVHLSEHPIVYDPSNTSDTFPNGYPRSARQVYLHKADQVVLDDGTIVTPTSGLTADFSVIGAGGVQDGDGLYSNNGYSIYYIRKDDGVENLYLRRMGYPGAAWSYRGTSGSVKNRAVFETDSDERRAQAFTVTRAGTLHYVTLDCYRDGAATSHVYVELQSDSSNLPSNTVLATAQAKSEAKIYGTSTGTWMQFKFYTPYTLVAGTQYWIVLKTQRAASSANHIHWIGYTGGYSASYPEAVYSKTTGLWTRPAEAAMHMEVFVTPSSSPGPLVLPSEYTRYAKIGHCVSYNPAASGTNQMLYAFEQRDREWRLRDIVSTMRMQVAAGGAGTYYDFIDWSRVFPYEPAIYHIKTSMPSANGAHTMYVLGTPYGHSIWDLATYSAEWAGGHAHRYDNEYSTATSPGELAVYWLGSVLSEDPSLYLGVASGGAVTFYAFVTGVTFLT